MTYLPIPGAKDDTPEAKFNDYALEAQALAEESIAIAERETAEKAGRAIIEAPSLVVTIEALREQARALFPSAQVADVPGSRR